MRWCLGTNGLNPNIDNTDQISVTFGTNHEVSIRFVLGLRTVLGGALYNNYKGGRLFTYNKMRYNQIDTSYVSYPSVPFMAEFKEAADSGVLELPFQFKFITTIG